MMMRRWVATAILCMASSAGAADPKFEYGKPVELKKVTWKAQVSAGLIASTGNARSVSFSAAGSASRDDAKNRVALDVAGAFVQTGVLLATDANMNMLVDPGEVSRIETATTKLWNLKLRYDRFLSLNNALYASTFAYGNEPAGKKVAAGAQVGYARRLYQNKRHLLQAEAGVDYTFERSTSAVPDLHIASLRAFLGYQLTLTNDINFQIDAEYLGNMNPLDGPGGRTIKPFRDSRVNGRVALTARLWKMLSFRASSTLRFDNQPQPQPAFALPYAPGYLPLAEKLDTLTELALVLTFL